MDREAWHAVSHGVAKSRTRLSDWTDWLTMLLGMQNGSATMDTVWLLLEKLNIELPYDTAIQKNWKQGLKQILVPKCS